MFQDWLPKANNWLPSVGDDSEAKDWLPPVGDVGDDGEASDSMDIIDMPMSSQDALFGFGMYTIPDNVLLEAHMRKKRRRRKAKWVHDRVNWNEHKAAKIYKNEFKAYNRMSEKAFNVLVELLRPSLTMSDTHAMSSTGAHNAISPEVIVSIGLRFMSGEPAKSLADVFVISRPSATRVIDMFLHAVEACKELELRLPSTEEELKKAMEEWNDLSTGTGALWGFIGAIDGWLACTDKPSKGQDLDGNQADYFSGHYHRHRHGLNIQAICDAKLRFIYFTVAAPGSTGDARAFKRCEELLQWITDLPKECFIGGDNAYPLSDSLVVPFSGADRFDEDKRTLNFFLSQLRIRIEMAFGRLTTKWRIFCSNLNFSLEKNIRICNVASRLHNFVIDQQEIEDLGSLEGTETTDQLRTMGGIEQFSDPRSPDNLGFLPNHEHPEQLAERPPQKNQQDEGMDDLMDGAMDDLMEDETSVIYTNLSRRDSILDYIQDLELERPDKNRSRNDN